MVVVAVLVVVVVVVGVVVLVVVAVALVDVEVAELVVVVVVTVEVVDDVVLVVPVVVDVVVVEEVTGQAGSAAAVALYTAGQATSWPVPSFRATKPFLRARRRLTPAVRSAATVLVSPPRELVSPQATTWPVSLRAAKAPSLASICTTPDARSAAGPGPESPQVTTLPLALSASICTGCPSGVALTAVTPDSSSATVLLSQPQFWPQSSSFPLDFSAVRQ
mmetsp:Transcript_94055/g.303848  ORF Transcript_94055/g.303848 Transcript_94055/m.303848 type:complete len:220 (-) Transcript_94055:973-1632(-)